MDGWGNERGRHTRRPLKRGTPLLEYENSVTGEKSRVVTPEDPPRGEPPCYKRMNYLTGVISGVVTPEDPPKGEPPC